MKPIESFFLSKPHWYCNPRAEKWLLVCTDVIAMGLAFCFAVILVAPFHGVDIFSVEPWFGARNAAPVQAYIAILGMTVGAFWSKGHYTKRKPFSNEIKDLLTVTLVLAMLDAAVLFLAKWEFSRAVMLLTWSFAPVLLVALRCIVKRSLMGIGGWVRPMVVIGWGENAVETALAFQDEWLMGRELVAFLVPLGHPKPQHNICDKYGNEIPSVSLGADPNLTVSQFGRPHVVMALEQGGIETHQEMILQVSRRNQDVQLVPALRGLPLYGMEVNHFFAHEVLLLTMRNNLSRRFPQLVKRGFDVVVSALILLLGSPVFLFIAIKVMGTGRPVFFGHTRVGQLGKPFKCYKFRTMAPNADQLLAELLARSPEARAEWERDFKLKNDPRITAIGGFLRKTSLDELPQLWNVLKGDMSLVGPRPVVTAELERYGNQVDYYLEAKPGITGLWQISGRNDVTYETRVYLDVWYVKNWSLFNDIVMLFRTIKVIFRRDGAY